MRAFGLEETHGILRRPEARIRANSARLGWTSGFASTQTEHPYVESFSSVPSHLVILHLDGYVNVDRWLAGKHEGRMIAAGGMFMMPGGIDFRVRLGGTLSTVHFYLDGQVIDDVARDMLRGDPSHLELVPRLGDSDPLLERLILSLRDELLDPSDSLYADYLARMAAARLIKAHSAQPCRVAAPRDLAFRKGGRQMTRAVEYLQAHLHKAVTLGDLAKAIDVSVSQLTAMFKRTVNQPPHRFIMGLRVERARALLANGDMPLAEIAIACGFSHQEHMTRIFKRETSLTPAVYRRGLR
jgi:AraC family transcriptional regulator